MMRCAVLSNKTASADILAAGTSGRLMKVVLGGMVGGASTKTPLAIEVHRGNGSSADTPSATYPILCGWSFPQANSTAIVPSGSAFNVDLGPEGVPFTDGLRLTLTQGTGTDAATLYYIACYYTDL